MEDPGSRHSSLEERRSRASTVGTPLRPTTPWVYTLNKHRGTQRSTRPLLSQDYLLAVGPAQLQEPDGLPCIGNL